MAEGHLNHRLAFTNWTPITLPYTAPTDGFIHLNANPKSVAGGVVILRCYRNDNDTTNVAVNTHNGEVATSLTFVEQGTVISEAYNVNVTATVKFKTVLMG